MNTTIKLAAITEVQTIAGQLAEAQRRIEHIDWLLSPSRAAQPAGAAALATERDMLKYQTLGNLMVDLRAAQARLNAEMCR